MMITCILMLLFSTMLLPFGQSSDELLGPPDLNTFTWIPANADDMSDHEQHYSFGFEIGKKFRHLIQDRINSNIYLQQTLIPTFVNTSIYDEFFKNNNNTYPMYTTELVGIADGANLLFETLFIDQMSEEFSYFLPSHLARENPERCSDLMWKDKTG